MYATTNLNDESNVQLIRLRNIVWLWCISEGYEDVSTGESICFTKNQKTTTFILETNKSRDELLTCIYEATEKYNYIFVVFWNAWKNNNFTSAAKLAQKVLDAIKNGNITANKIEKLLTENKE